MRIIYFDIDCLRPDHLGCYGYKCSQFLGNWIQEQMTKGLCIPDPAVEILQERASK